MGYGLGGRLRSQTTGRHQRLGTTALGRLWTPGMAPGSRVRVPLGRSLGVDAEIDGEVGLAIGGPCRRLGGREVCLARCPSRCWATIACKSGSGRLAIRRPRL